MTKLQLKQYQGAATCSLGLCLVLGEEVIFFFHQYIFTVMEVFFLYQNLSSRHLEMVNMKHFNGNKQYQRVMARFSFILCSTFSYLLKTGKGLA